MDITTGVVEGIKVLDAKEGKFGVYYPNLITIKGVTYTKNSKTLEPLVHLGDKLKVLFTTNESSQGKVFNNIDKFEVLEKSEDTETDHVETVKTTNTSKSTKTEGTGTTKTDNLTEQTLTAKDVRIAKMNAVTSAIAFIAQGDHGHMTIKDITNVADQILEYTLDSYVKF